MIAMTLAEIADAVGGQVADAPEAGPASVRVTGDAFADSRHVVAGGLFAAIAGERVDGHVFAAQTVADGAAAVLSTRPVGVPAVVVPDVVAALGGLATHVLRDLPGLRIVGITGSQGKTSTKDLLAAILSDAGPTIAPAGSLNTEVGVPLTVLRVDRETRYLVVEMGARGIGHIGYLAAMVRPSVGVVLNVGHAHLGEFGSQEAIAITKGELVEALPVAGTAVLNADDPRVFAMAARTRAGVLAFGQSSLADLSYRVTHVDDEARVQVELAWQGRRAEVALHYVGAHQAQNAAAAVAAAVALGLPFADVCDSLARARPTSHWRMQVSRRADGVTIVNDAYNANPDSMRAALDATDLLVTGRRRGRVVAVLGEMCELGATSADEHMRLGHALATHRVDVLVTVGKAAAAIAVGAREADGGPTLVVAAGDRDEAITALADLLAADDIVLVKASRAVQLEHLAAALLADTRPAGSDVTDGGR
jgi:UDP-N-acetylmuramoyl-tripeptide--D-alanyl-D-alanine ligase